MARWLIGVLAILLTLLWPGATLAEEPTWRERDDQGRSVVHLHFFWSRSCPHCLEAKPELERLDEAEWLVVHTHEISQDPEAARYYVELAEALGEQARYVPGFAFCGTLVQGYPGASELERRLEACRRGESIQDGAPTEFSMPGLGPVDMANWSLPVTTIVLAALDAFNPCAFFVLLFLLSLLVRSHDRRRMILISTIFVTMSGLWYFVLMAAWLNVYLWLGELRWVTLVAGLVAMAMAVINIKDFFALHRGPSLSIPESAKPSLIARMRRLANATSLLSAVFGTFVLAIAANSYELLCTAGFPMIYTRVLSLADLSLGTHYLYLLLYNVIYVLPLAIIAGVSIKTLASHKLQEREGRGLKLLAGLMMLGLGLALVVAPEMLSRIGPSLGLVVAAGTLTALALVIDRRRSGHSPKRSTGM